jgi:hypothetical protein
MVVMDVSKLEGLQADRHPTMFNAYDWVKHSHFINHRYQYFIG